MVQTSDILLIYPLGYNVELESLNYTQRGIINKVFYYICTRKGIDMEHTVLSDFVKEMRRQFGLTQVDLADKSGVGLRFVRDLEQGKQTLRLDKVNQVLGLFGRQVGPVEINEKRQEGRS